MEARKYCVYNRAKESTLSAGVTVIDTTLEPLKVLKVMIEGLAKNTETGLWLTPLNEIPRVPRLAPFDLVYLDKDQKVIQGAELLPGIEFPAFEHSAESALVLPFKTMSSSRTRPGDQQAIEAAAESASEVAGVETTPGVEAAALAEPELSGRPAGQPQEPKPATGKIDKSMAASLLEKSEAFRAAEPAIERDIRSTRPGVIPKGPRVLGPKQKPAPVQKEPDQPVESAALVDDATDDAAQQALDKAAQKTAAERPLKVFYQKQGVETEEQEMGKAPPLPESKPAARLVERDKSAVLPVPARKRPEVTEPAESAPEPALHPVETEPKATPPLNAPPRPIVVVGKHIEPKDKPEEEEDQRVPVMTRVLRWLYPDLAPPHNSRRAIRRSAPDLMAYHWVDGQLLPLEVGNISSSGVYLKTEERWQPGERISLILQRKGPPEESAERQFLIDAGAVRWGHDGVGLAFILPPGMDVHIWEGPLKRRDDEKEPEYILREFRMARAVAFVRRICPAAVEEVDLLLHRELSNYRLSSAVEIALRAEAILMNEPDAAQLSAPSEMVVRILELGSWAEGDLLHQMWAGMLATCCTADGQDASNALFIDLLTPLTTVHARILQAACTKATKVTSARGEITSYPLYFTADEMMKISGTNDLSKIQRAVALMGDFGIFEKSAKSSFIQATEKSKTTPTTLGLQLFARCSGHREIQ